MGRRRGHRSNSGRGLRHHLEAAAKEVDDDIPPTEYVAPEVMRTIIHRRWEEMYQKHTQGRPAPNAARTSEAALASIDRFVELGYMLLLREFSLLRMLREICNALPKNDFWEFLRAYLSAVTDLRVDGEETYTRRIPEDESGGVELVEFPNLLVWLAFRIYFVHHWAALPHTPARWAEENLRWSECIARAAVSMMMLDEEVAAPVPCLPGRWGDVPTDDELEDVE